MATHWVPYLIETLSNSCTESSGRWWWSELGRSGGEKWMDPQRQWGTRVGKSGIRLDEDVREDSKMTPKPAMMNAGGSGRGWEKMLGSVLLYGVWGFCRLQWVWENEEDSVILQRMVQRRIFWLNDFEQRSGWNEAERNHLDIRECTLGNANSRCKGPEVGLKLRSTCASHSFPTMPFHSACAFPNT